MEDFLPETVSVRLPSVLKPLVGVLLVELLRGSPAAVWPREVVYHSGWDPAVFGVPPVRAVVPGQRDFEGGEEIVDAVSYYYAVIRGH